MNIRHSSFKRFVPYWKATWSFIVHIISIVTGKKFRKVPRFIASSENRIDPAVLIETLDVETILLLSPTFYGGKLRRTPDAETK
jgi:hypothetical protein